MGLGCALCCRRSALTADINSTTCFELIFALNFSCNSTNNLLCYYGDVAARAGISCGCYENKEPYASRCCLALPLPPPRLVSHRTYLSSVSICLGLAQIGTRRGEAGQGTLSTTIYAQERCYQVLADTTHLIAVSCHDSISAKTLIRLGTIILCLLKVLASQLCSAASLRLNNVEP